MPEALVYIVFFSVSLVTTTFLPPTFSGERRREAAIEEALVQLKRTGLICLLTAFNLLTLTLRSPDVTTDPTLPPGGSHDFVMTSSLLAELFLPRERL
jgi:hypothetical protein